MIPKSGNRFPALAKPAAYSAEAAASAAKAGSAGEARSEKIMRKIDSGSVVCKFGAAKRCSKSVTDQEVALR